MTAGDLVGISLSIHEIVWVVRYLIDLVPSMLELMEPIEQVATTLDSVPLIEPHPDIKTEDKLKPEKFRGHLVFKVCASRKGTPTTWTVLQQDGPNHLGLLYNVLPGHQMALITSDCAPFQLVFYYHPLWSFLIPCLVCERLLCAPVDGRCEPAPAPARCISLWTQSFLFGNSIALQ